MAHFILRLVQHPTCPALHTGVCLHFYTCEFACIALTVINITPACLIAHSILPTPHACRWQLVLCRCLVVAAGS